jgi:hypothetical protein
MLDAFGILPIQLTPRHPIIVAIAPLLFATVSRPLTSNAAGQQLFLNS